MKPAPQGPGGDEQFPWNQGNQRPPREAVQFIHPAWKDPNEAVEAGNGKQNDQPQNARIYETQDHFRYVSLANEKNELTIVAKCYRLIMQSEYARKQASSPFHNIPGWLLAGG